MGDSDPKMGWVSDLAVFKPTQGKTIPVHILGDAHLKNSDDIGEVTEEASAAQNMQSIAIGDTVIWNRHLTALQAKTRKITQDYRLSQPSCPICNEKVHLVIDYRDLTGSVSRKHVSVSFDFYTTHIEPLRKKYGREQ